MVKTLQGGDLWGGAGQCNATMISDHLQIFQEKDEKCQWKQLARDIWSVSSILGHGNPE